MALAAAAALIGWSSIIVARSREKNAQLRLGQLAPADSAIEFHFFVSAGQSDFRKPVVGDALARFRDVADPPRRIQIWRSIDPRARCRPAWCRRPIQATSSCPTGSLPPCAKASCDGLAVHGSLEIGDVIHFSKRALVRIVGVASIRTGAFALGDELGDRAVVSPAFDPALRRVCGPPEAASSSRCLPLVRRGGGGCNRRQQ